MISIKNSNHKMEEKIPVKLSSLDIIINLSPKETLIMNPIISDEQNPCYIRDKESTQGDHISYEYSYSKLRSDPELSYFVKAMAESMAFLDLLDENSSNPTEQLDSKINSFLIKYLNTTYRDLIKKVDFDSFNSNDYGEIPKSKLNLKKRLFDYRARLYLASLAAADQANFNLDSLLEKIHTSRIYPIKKEIDEPTFNYLRKYLAK
nr:hypothetical protein [Candidatus Woesearchaeota archaeon]